MQEGLRKEQSSISFEVVTRCMEHHGQVPQGEYLVATAMTRTLPDGRLQVLPTHPQSSCHKGILGIAGSIATFGPCVSVGIPW